MSLRWLPFCSRTPPDTSPELSFMSTAAWRCDGESRGEEREKGVRDRSHSSASSHRLWPAQTAQHTRTWVRLGSAYTQVVREYRSVFWFRLKADHSPTIIDTDVRGPRFSVSRSSR